MAMGENNVGDDQFDNHSDVLVGGEAPKSPWKTPAVASPAVASDSVSWPALTGAQRRAKNNAGVDFKSRKSSPPARADVDGCGGAPPKPQKAAVEQQKFHGPGNMKHPHKQYPVHQNKAGLKHGPNGVPPYSVPLTYYPPTFAPVYHDMFPMPPVSTPGYAYHLYPGPFPRVETHLVKSGTNAPSQAFTPPANGGFQPARRPDSSAHDANSVGRRPNSKEPGGQMNPSWNNQQSVATNNFHLQQNRGPRPSIRPPSFGSNFFDGSNFAGPPGAIYYFPAPPGFVRVPYHPFLVQYPGVFIQTSPVAALRANIVKQIEYYFSDENLQNDPYLISLMDDQGWVLISIIAGFKRVKRMNVEIQFILDSLLASETIEVQGEKIRRRSEWSKWIPASVVSKSSSVASDAVKNDNENKKANPESKMELASPNGCFVDPLLSSENCLKESNCNGSEQNKDKVLSAGEIQKNSFADMSFCMELSSQPDNRGNTAELNNVSGSPAISQGADSVKLVIQENRENVRTQVLSNLDVQSPDDSSNDFSSPFLLDEDLELEQITVTNEDPFIVERIDDEDDKIMVNDQAVERLVIVTQNTRTSEGRSGEASKTISSELASAISDGLYFYEQELNSKRSCSRYNEPTDESRDENPRSSPSHASVLSSRALDHSTGESSCEGPGISNSRKNQSKSVSKPRSIHKQRLFPANFRAHGSGENSLGIISESPPSDAVGFFFGSTPPDNHGLRAPKLSASPHSNLSGSSPPVGSLPKPIPPFQHPSHKLLEENGFKQQMYKKYHKRCISERKKLGIGCSEDTLAEFLDAPSFDVCIRSPVLLRHDCPHVSEQLTPHRQPEMNKLYRFWSYFLGNMFSPSMYTEFKTYALDDAAASYNYGIECLFRFYSYGLEKEFRGDLYEDFEQLTLDFYRKGNLYGLETYWAFHHFREARDHREPLTKHPELDRLLREEYRSLDGFKAKNATPHDVNH